MGTRYILSALIAGVIQKKRQLADINSAILNELDELRYRLAWTCWKIAARAQKVDRRFWEWLRQIASSYSGALHDKELDLRLSKLSSYSDADLQASLAKIQPQGRALGLKRFSIPATTANLQNVGGLPEEYQRLLFHIIRLIEMANQDIDEADYYFKLTFDTSIESVNREIAKDNMESCYEFINGFALSIIELIGRLDKYRGRKFRKSSLSTLLAL